MHFASMPMHASLAAPVRSLCFPCPFMPKACLHGCLALLTSACSPVVVMLN